MTLAAVSRGDAEVARRWLLLREFRTATRFTRPGADATRAVEALGQERLSPRRASAAVVKDLLDAYQARLRELLADADAAARRGFAARGAQATAQAAGYWRLLTARYTQDRGAATARDTTGAFDRLARAALTTTRPPTAPRAPPSDARSTASPPRLSRPRSRRAAPSSCCASWRWSRSSTTAACRTSA